MTQLFGAVEAGGTKFVCMVASGPKDIIAETRIPTTNPDETINQAINFFKPYTRGGKLEAVGIASFGPVDLNPGSATYGFITTTPKQGWKMVDLLGQIQNGLHVPVAFDTDVNAAAFGEFYWDPGNRKLESFIYITVGTGIGVGVLIDGRPLHGLIHTEAGHIAIPHDLEKDPFQGACPYHGDCWEGLASGPAMERRWSRKAETIPDDHLAWELEAGYTGRAIANLICSYSPQRIVLGGGVSQHPGLHATIRDKVQKYLNGYIQSPMILDRIDEYIVPPALENRSGVLGAIAFAKQLRKSD